MYIINTTLTFTPSTFETEPTPPRCTRLTENETIDYDSSPPTALVFHSLQHPPHSPLLSNLSLVDIMRHWSHCLTESRTNQLTHLPILRLPPSLRHRGRLRSALTAWRSATSHRDDNCLTELYIISSLKSYCNT